MTRRCAIVLHGESFRLIPYKSRDKSIQEQIAAANSHIKLFQRITELGFSTEVFLTTYTTEYDLLIAEIYHQYLYSCKFFANTPTHKFENVRDAMDLIQIERYDCVISMRADIELKPAFIEQFVIDDKIVFLSVCSYANRKTYVGNPRVNDVFVQFPKNYFNILSDAQRKPIAYYHDFFDYLPVHRGQYRMMADKYYDSDTSKDRNPYYRIVNLPESETTLSEGYEFPKDF